MKQLQFLTAVLLLLLNGMCPLNADQAADQIINKVDGYRRVSNSFTMKIKISDYKDDRLRETAEFSGLFKGNEKSLLLCTKGRNMGMKVLMKGDYMWVSLTGSRRALRITPMQRLMGQASNGDVAKTTFSTDYAAEIVEKNNKIIKLSLKAKRKGATYQKVRLYIDAQNYQPLKAEFFLLSGKHFKTAFYQDFMIINGNAVVRKIKIEDIIKKGRYSVLEYLDYKNARVPVKYFNVMYLPKLEL